MSINNAINLEQLYKDDESADVYFALQNRYGTETKIPAHKSILKSKSAVFHKMFYGELREKSAVTIVDVRAEAFLEYLQFFYLTSFDLTADYMAEILRLMDKYDTLDFIILCDEFIKETAITETAYVYYELALSFNLSDTTKLKLEELICKQPKVAFQFGPAHGSQRAVLVNILQSTKWICEEIDVFDGVMIWARTSLENKNEPITVDSMKAELGDSLNGIRFPLMSIEQFCSCFGRYPNILPPEQYRDIFDHLYMKKDLTVAAHFNRSTRIPMKSLIQFQNSAKYEENSRMCIGIVLPSHDVRNYLISFGIHLNDETYRGVEIECKVRLQSFLSSSHIYVERHSLLFDDNGNCNVTMNHPIYFEEDSCNIMFILHLSRDISCKYLSVPVDKPTDICLGPCKDVIFLSDLQFERVFSTEMKSLKSIANW